MAKREQMRTLSGVGVAVVCACALVTACGGSDDRDATASTTSVAAEATTSAPSTTESTTTTTIDEEGAAILAAVDGYWDALLTAGNPSDPDHPALAQHADGPALDQAVNVLSERQRLGQFARLPPDAAYSHNPRLVSSGGPTAEVVDCAVDDKQVVDAETGVVLDGRTVTNLWTVGLEDMDGAWRVVTLRIDSTWDGATTCDQ